jgi:hypothetical protein
MSMVDCRGVFMDRIPMVGFCRTCGHRRFEMCALVCDFMFCASIDNFARKLVEY